jgi:hypothetical protein
VLSVEKRQMAFTQIYTLHPPAHREIRLTPVCEVRVHFQSTELEKLGLPIKFPDCNIFYEQRMPVLVEQDASIWLPAGRYRYSATDSHFAGWKDEDFEIATGQREKTLNIDLPASRLTKLVGRPAPELTRVEAWTTPRPVKLVDFHGKVVVLAFLDCRDPRKFTGFVELHDAFHRQGLEVVAISNAISGPKAAWEEAMKKAEAYLKRPLPFPVALDGKEPKFLLGATSSEYDIRRTFFAIAIDRNGDVIGQLEVHTEEGDKMLRHALAKAELPSQ